MSAPILALAAARKTSVAGSLSAASITWASENVDSAGWADWHYIRDFGAGDRTKLSATGMSGLTLSNMSLVTNVAGDPSTFSWSGSQEDGAGVPGDNTPGAARFAQTTSGAATLSFTVPATTSTYHLRVQYGTFDLGGATTPPVIRFTLSDGSATAITPTLVVSAWGCLEVTYSAGSPGQTLTCQFEMGNNTYQCWADMAAYKTS